ncbi:hypothetical protein R3P38DRAFT_3185209 [Favolaschia claudopus]|uniref:Uncharacterized protein n=1 Tax=Favolaschia claudopus TaxID=2862362 RepID=A0AAW0C7A4_9AGAR
MPPRKSGPTLAPISWEADNHNLLRKMFAEVEKKDNRLVIIGKKNPSENSVGLSKIAVFKGIGKIILPDAAAIDEDGLAKRVKNKYDSMYALYKKQAKRLRQTGGGLGGNDAKDEDDDSSHEYMSFYIPQGGPEDTAEPRVKNLWSQITEEFEFFPFFHNLYSTRANVNPPVIITGVGPTGRKIVHLQPPSDKAATPAHVPFPDHLIDPALLNLSATPPPLPPATPLPPQSRSSSPIPWSPSPQKKRPSPVKRSPLKENRVPPSSTQKVKVKSENKNDTVLSAALLRARENVKKTPAKRTLEDTLVSLHEATVKQAAKRAATQDDLAKRRLMIEEKGQVLEMFRAGMYSQEAAMEEIAKIESQYTFTQPSPAKRRRPRDILADQPNKNPSLNL